MIRHGNDTYQRFFQVVRPQPVILSPESGIARVSPRPLAKHQADYRQKFDARTLFYDVFQSGDDVVLNGPPLLNIRTDLGEVGFADESQRFDFHLTDAERTQASRVLDCSVSHLTMSSSVGKMGINVGGDLSHVFAGHFALTTKSKDNELQWIADWARFHAVHHGVTAVLLYDNGSTKYEPEDILDSLATVRQLAVVVVVSWPFLFGPQGGSWDAVKDAPWDSDFCEYGIQEHAHHRFLRHANGIINADIDELVMTHSGETVFEVLERSGAPWIHYDGQWVETVTNQESSLPRFKDFTFYDTSRPATTRKWTADPRKLAPGSQLKPHSISQTSGEATDEVTHRHFMGLSSNWKWVRTENTPYNSTLHKRDVSLMSALTSSGFLRLPDHAPVDTPHPYRVFLESLRSNMATMLTDRAIKSESWFYRDDCLVFDLAKPHRVGVDIVRLGTDVTVKVVGRSPEAQKALNRVAQSLGLSQLSRHGHWLLASLSGATSTDALSGSIAEEIAALVYRLEAYAANLG